MKWEGACLGVRSELRAFLLYIMREGRRDMMKKLDLLFENEEGKTVTYSLDAPIEPADAEVINEVMDTIIAENVFETNGGAIVGKKGARIVDRQVEEIDIEAAEA